MTQHTGRIGEKGCGNDAAYRTEEEYHPWDVDLVFAMLRFIFPRDR